MYNFILFWFAIGAITCAYFAIKNGRGMFNKKVVYYTLWAMLIVILSGPISAAVKIIINIVRKTKAPSEGSMRRRNRSA